jgi:hypothetical protein
MEKFHKQFFLKTIPDDRYKKRAAKAFASERDIIRYERDDGDKTVTCKKVKGDGSEARGKRERFLFPPINTLASSAFSQFPAVSHVRLRCSLASSPIASPDNLFDPPAR